MNPAKISTRTVSVIPKENRNFTQRMYEFSRFQFDGNFQQSKPAFLGKVRKKI